MTFKKSFITLFLIFISFFVLAQNEKDSIIQFSGLVVEGDSMYGIPGVAVYVPGTGRGAITNEKGFFTLPVLLKDSVLIRSLGYKDKYIKIPDSLEGNSLSLMIKVQPDTIELPAFVLPYKTEREFKQAFLALELPQEESIDHAKKNLDPGILNYMLHTSDATASMNHRYFVQREVAHHEQKYTVGTIPFLNPFAWAKFIKQIKEEGIRKDKEWEVLDDMKMAEEE